MSAYTAASQDNLIRRVDGWPSYGQLLDTVSKAIAFEGRMVADEKRKRWGARFQEWSKDLWKLATPAFKAGAPSPGFDSEGMRAEWEPVWKPE
eukprot:4210236-Pyramimonas_sp.AAC.1